MGQHVVRISSFLRRVQTNENRQNVVVYPISSGKLINVGAFHAKEELAGTPFDGPWVTTVEKDELLETHAHWEPELQAILQVYLTLITQICISKLIA